MNIIIKRHVGCHSHELAMARGPNSWIMMDTNSAAFVVHLSSLLSSSFLVLEEITKFLEAKGQQMLPHA